MGVVGSSCCEFREATLSLIWVLNELGWLSTSAQASRELGGQVQDTLLFHEPVPRANVAEWGLTRACPTLSVLSIYFPVFSFSSDYPCLPLPQIMDKCFIFVDMIDYFFSILLGSLNISEALRSRSRLPISKIMTAGSVKQCLFLVIRYLLVWEMCGFGRC